MRLNHCVFILFFLSFTSCNKMNPANFWDDFDSENRVTTEGDFQGRFGYKIVHFKKDNETYTISDVLSFAKDNGWEVYNKTFYKLEDIASWQKEDSLVYKQSITGFEPSEIVREFVKVFPRYINTNFTVFEFDTDGMILVNSETNDTTQRVGFILLSEDKTMMTIYHLWGETKNHY